MRLSVEQALQDNNRFANCNALAELKYCGWEIPQRRSITNDEIRFYAWLCRSAVAMLKEQERKKASWDYGTQCSVCKGTIIPPKDRKVRVNFCPWCGADMRDSYEQEGGKR